MEIFSALLALCAGNSPVTGEFLAQKPVTRGFDVFFHLYLNKRLNKQSWGWWFETPSRRPLWRHCNEYSCKHFGLHELNVKTIRFCRYSISDKAIVMKLCTLHGKLGEFINLQRYDNQEWNTAIQILQTSSIIMNVLRSRDGIYASAN